MFRSSNKKRLFSLFAAIALAWCGLASPMKKIASEWFPDDCLCEILQFHADKGGKNTAELRCVNKKFKFVIDKYDCYLADIKNGVYFLPFRLTQHIASSINEEDRIIHNTWLDGKNQVKKFGEKIDDSRSPFSKLKKLSFFVHMRLEDKGLDKLLPKPLKKFFSLLKKNNSRLECLQIADHNNSWFTTVNGCGGNLQAKDFYADAKDTITNEELNMCGDVLEKVCICGSKNFGTSEVKWPGNFKELNIENCKKFNIKYLKGLPHLKILTLKELDNVDSNKLKNADLKNLESLSVEECKFFNMKGLGALKKLDSLFIDDYGTVVGCTPEELKNVVSLELREFKKSISKNGEFSQKAAKKVYAILKIIEKLKKMKTLIVFGYYSNDEITELLKKMQNGGKQIVSPDLSEQLTSIVSDGDYDDDYDDDNGKKEFFS